MNIRCGEIKKLLSFKEIYIGLFFCTLILALFFYTDTHEFTFWKEVQDFIPRVGFWFIAAMIIIGLARIFPYENELEIEELLKTYKYGRKKLILSKVFITFVYSFFIVTLVYLIALVFYACIYPIGNINMPMSKVHYTDLWSQVCINTGKLTQLQFLLYEYVYMIFAAFSFGLFVVWISRLTKNARTTIAICGGAFALLEFFNKYITQINFSGFFYYIFQYPLSIIYEFGYNGMLSFRYFRIVDLSKVWIVIMYIFASIIFNIYLIFRYNS